MKHVIASTVGIALTLAGATAASAAGGCGAGFHRGPFGGCRPNGRIVAPVVVAPGLAIGTYYPGRGYWDGHRYWHNRERWHGGWRYR